MKKTINLILITVVLFVISCSNPELEKELNSVKQELTKAKEQLSTCSNELETIKNTPEQRLIRAKKLIANNDLTGAKSEFQGIVNNYEGTQDAINASREIQKIDRTIEEKRKEEERKKALGYKILKPTSTVKYGELTLKFEKIWKGKRWSFDDHGREYSLRDAKRGNSHILARVSISSEANNPQLPPVLVYQMDNGALRLLGTLGYEFRRWKDYGSYLGNYADYGNDFSQSKTIPFNLGVQLSNDDLDGKSIFVVMKKKGCFSRNKKTIGNPEIEYRELSCSPKRILKIEDFDEEYVLLKKI